MVEPEEPNPLAKAYYWLEDKYYGLADWMQARGARVYDWFIEPIEKRGIPSFPVAAFIALLFVILVGYAIYPSVSPFIPSFGQQQTSVAITVLSQGSPVPGATVSLSINGDSRESTTDANGMASFEGLPSGATALARVSKVGFDPAAQSINLGSDREASISLSASKPISTPTPPQVLTIVTFADSETGDPINGVSVIYRTADKGVVQDATKADGVIAAYFSDSEVTMYASQPDYKSARENVKQGVDGQVIKMVRIAAQPTPTDTPDCSKTTCKAQLADVSVSVVDSSGSPVEARVELHISNSLTPAKSVMTSQGSALFSLAAAVGARVYVIAYPSDSSTYATGQSDTMLLSQGTNAIEVNVSTKSASALNTLTARVTDSDGNVIEGANVYVFTQSGIDPLSQGFTDPSGQYSVEVNPNSAFSVLAYKEGFLPSGRLSLGYGMLMANLKLAKPIAGNHAQVRVTVYDEGGVNPVPGASVLLSYFQDGFPTGIPAVSTNEVGQAVFDLVPANVMLKATATFSVQDGTSDEFSPNPAAVWNDVRLVLDRPMGSVIVAVKNPFTKGNIAGATATVYNAGTQEGETCTTDANGGCEIDKVSANVPLTVVLDAPGFVEKTVDGVIVLPQQRTTITFRDDLVPSELANESRLWLGLYDATCQNQTAGPIEKGKTYCLLVDYNIPNNATTPAGVYVRVNGDGDVNGDNSYISYYNDLSEMNLDANHLVVTRASKFDSSSGFNCQQAHSDSQNLPAKWVNYEFQGVQGNRQTKIYVFVKPTAKGGDYLDINYFAYAARSVNGQAKYYRIPQDNDLGTAKSNANKDWCQATTTDLRFKISDGTTYFSDLGALSLSFSTPLSVNRTASLVTPQGSTFGMYADGRAFAKPTSPYLHIYAGDGNRNKRDYINFLTFTYNDGTQIALDGKSEQDIDFDPAQLKQETDQDGNSAWLVQGTFSANATLPIPYGKIYAELGDRLKDKPVIVSASAPVRITGTAVLNLAANPLAITAQKDTDVAATASANGFSATQTILAINSIEGRDSPFGPNYNDGDYSITGDGTKDKGLNGKYTFKKLHPLMGGQFNIAAGGTLDPRFAATNVTITSNLVDFLSVYPSSLSLGCSPSSLAIKNTLDNADAYVTVSNYNSCVDFTGVDCSGKVNDVCSYYSFPLKEGLQQALGVTPRRAGKCSVYVSGYVTSDTWLSQFTSSSTTVDTSVTCSALEPSCSVGTADSFVIGGDANQGSTQATATLNYPPRGTSVTARVTCGGSTDSQYVETNDSDQVSAQSTCAYPTSVTSMTTTPITAEFFDASGNSLASCTSYLTELPPGTYPYCKLGYTPKANGITTLKALYFNLPESANGSGLSESFFTCSNDDLEPHSAAIVRAVNQVSASYDCDYSQADGAVFNATAFADRAFCFNQTVKISTNSYCSLGRDSIPYGQCAPAVPYKRCEGDRSSPVLSSDSACCSELLGNSYQYETAPIEHCGLVNPPLGKCDLGDNGGTPAGQCVVVGGVPLPLLCTDTGSSIIPVSNGACCPAALGYAYDSATNACVKPSLANACVVTDGTTSVVTLYGNCSAVHQGLRCEGSGTTPTLTPDNTCCPAGQIYSDNAKSCVAHDASCNNFIDSSRPSCLLANGYNVPSPYECDSGQLFGNTECCLNYDYQGHAYTPDSTNGYCIEVPPAKVEPTCTIYSDSVADNSAGTNAVLRLDLTRLNKFITGTASITYACDTLAPVTKTSKVIGKQGQIIEIPLSCFYAKSLVDYSVSPYATISLSGNGASESIDCGLQGTRVNNGLISVPGSSGQSASFAANITVDDQYWPLTPAPLGPLNQLSMQVSAVRLPQGTDVSKGVSLLLSCNKNDAPSPMALSDAQNGVWKSTCTYSSSAAPWPRVHSPRAFFRLEDTNSTGTFFIPANGPAGIDGSFGPVSEYAQPVSSGIYIDKTIQTPTPADQTLTVRLLASFAGLPPSTTQSAQIDCANGRGAQAVSLAVDADGTASATLECSYMFDVARDYNAKAVFAYNAVAGGSLESLTVSSSVSVPYQPSGSQPSCNFTNIPTQALVVGDANNNFFKPSLRISGLLAMPKSVSIDCANGKIVGATITSAPNDGTSLVAIATAKVNCAYQYSSLMQDGVQVESNTVDLAATVDGAACILGAEASVPIAASADVPTFTFTDYAFTPATGGKAADPSNGIAGIAGTNAQATFGLQATLAHAAADSKFSAQIACGKGSTTAGQSTTLNLDADDTNSIFSAADASCEYPPISTEATRTITATLYRTSSGVQTRVTTISKQFTQKATPQDTADFQACSPGILLPFILSTTYGGQGSPSTDAENINRQTTLAAQAQMYYSQGKAAVLGPTGVFAASSAIASRQLYYSALFGSTVSDVIPVYNGMNKQMTFQVSPGPTNCLIVSGPSSFTLDSGQLKPVAFSLANTQSCIDSASSGSGLTDTMTVYAKGLDIGNPSISVSVTVSPLGMDNEFNALAVPWKVVVPQRIANAPEPMVLVNNMNKPVAITLAGGSLPSTIDPRKASDVITTQKPASFTMTAGGFGATDSLSSKVTTAPTGLGNYDVIGNVLTKDSLNGKTLTGFECSGNDFCDKDALAMVEGALEAKINKGLQQLSAKRTETIPNSMYDANLGGAISSTIQSRQNSFNQNGGYGNSAFNSPFGGFMFGGVNKNSCSAMMTCYTIMSATIKDQNGGVDDNLATMLPLAFCSDPQVQQSLASGNSEAFSSILLASTLYKQVLANRKPHSSGGGTNAAPMMSLGGAMPGTINVPVKVTVDPTKQSSFGEISCITQAGSLTARCTYAAIADSSKGYPYVAKDSTSKLAVAFDGGNPVLATINKYGSAPKQCVADWKDAKVGSEDDACVGATVKCDPTDGCVNINLSSNIRWVVKANLQGYPQLNKLANGHTLEEISDDLWKYYQDEAYDPKLVKEAIALGCKPNEQLGYVTLDCASKLFDTATITSQAAANPTIPQGDAAVYNASGPVGGKIALKIGVEQPFTVKWKADGGIQIRITGDSGAVQSTTTDANNQILNTLGAPKQGELKLKGLKQGAAQLRIFSLLGDELSTPITIEVGPATALTASTDLRFWMKQKGGLPVLKDDFGDRLVQAFQIQGSNYSISQVSLLLSRYKGSAVTGPTVLVCKLPDVNNVNGDLTAAIAKFYQGGNLVQHCIQSSAVTGVAVEPDNLAAPKTPATANFPQGFLNSFTGTDVLVAYVFNPDLYYLRGNNIDKANFGRMYKIDTDGTVKMLKGEVGANIGDPALLKARIQVTYTQDGASKAISTLK